MQFLKKLSRHFLKISLLFALCTPTVFLNSTLVFASDIACTCYCGDNTDGAVSAGLKPSLTECSSFCKEKDKILVGCYPAGVETPEDDAKCWTELECANYALDSFGSPKPGTFGGQNPYCVKTKLGDATGYCYGEPIGVKLNVPVLGQATVYGFHEYLALAYKFLLPAMSLIAVVMVMVGGLEYVVSGGSAKRVDKAKHRITNALVGLVILMSAYAIAALLDPRLVNLMALRTPLLKQVIFLDPNSFCENLAQYGFTISPTKGDCGGQGTITAIDENKAQKIQSNFKVNDKCDFSTCAEGGQACVTEGGVNSCISCSDVGGILSGPTPSDYLCSQIAARADSFDKNTSHVYSCLMHYSGGNTCVEFTYDGDPYINCPKLVEDADKLDDPCRAYENITVTKAKTSPLTTTLAGTNAYESSATLCQSDPCKLAGRKGFSGCAFNEGSGLLDSLSLGPVDTAYSLGYSIGSGAYLNSCTGR